MMAQLGSGAQGRIKKFYKQVSVEETPQGFAVHLDSRPAKTPGRSLLAAPERRLAEAIASEWREQGEEVDLPEMALTRLAASVIDLAANDRAQWTDEVLNYLRSDLLCYRADEPASLVERQAAIWDPLLQWAEENLDVKLKVTAGIVAVEQPAEAFEAALRALEAMDDWTLMGAVSATQISGSAVIGLALARRAFPAGDLFRASRVDEHFQAERWGMDAEAAAREARLERAFAAADKWFDALGPSA